MINKCYASLIIIAIINSTFALSFKFKTVLDLDVTFDKKEAVNSRKFFYNINSMTGPEGICVDKKSVIYLMDTWAGKLKVFDSDGSLIKIVGNRTEFTGLRNIEVDNNLNIYLIQNGCVSIYDSSFTFLKKVDLNTKKSSKYLFQVSKSNQLTVLDVSKKILYKFKDTIQTYNLIQNLNIKSISGSFLNDKGDISFVVPKLISPKDSTGIIKLKSAFKYKVNSTNIIVFKKKKDVLIGPFVTSNNHVF